MRMATLKHCFAVGISVAWGASVPPTFKLDLDLPPEKRWQGALEVVLNQHPFEYSFQPTFANYNATLFGHLKPEEFSQIAVALHRNYPEKAAELKSLSTEFARLGHYVSYEYLAAWAYFHELAHTDLLTDKASVNKACTAILAKTIEGKVLHGGNMDQEPFAVRNLTLHVIFMRGGNVLFQGVDWYWFNMGVTRAVRRGVASVQENWRGSWRAGSRPHDQVLQAIDNGVVPQTWVFRDLLTSPPDDFESVVKHLETVQLAAPFYIAVGGPNGKGAIITRDDTKALHTARFDENDEWFLVQTNYDRWLPDDVSDPRRTSGEHTMRGFGQVQGATFLSLFAATSQPPVYNTQTAFTALMDPESGELHAYVRYPTCPAAIPSATRSSKASLMLV